MSINNDDAHSATIRLDAAAYLFEVTDGSVKVDLSELRVHEPNEEHSAEASAEVRVTISSDASETEITEALQLIIQNISQVHLPKRFRRIEETRACVMLMFEASNKVLKAARAIKGFQERVHLKR